MKIRMIVSQCGSEDGHAVREFKAGVTYEVAEGMGCRFLQRGFAEKVKPEEMSDA